MPGRDETLRFRDKRNVLFGKKTTAEQLREVGSMFMAAERYDDALEFFQRAGAADLTRRVAEAAMADGDTPLYMRAKKALGEQIEEPEWLALAKRAEASGKHSAAHLALDRAGRHEEAERLRSLMPGAHTGTAPPGAPGRDGEERPA
jgi:tetratricopeptide (TPR) repeat protein